MYSDDAMYSDDDILECYSEYFNNIIIIRKVLVTTDVWDFAGNSYVHLTNFSSEEIGLEKLEIL